MSKFNDVMNRAEQSSSYENNIMTIIDGFISKFIKKIKEGYGYITEDDVMRQFINAFPEFENMIFNKENLESYIIAILNNKGLIKTSEEIEETF